MDVTVPPGLRSQPIAAVARVVEQLAAPVAALHRPSQLQVSWSELDDDGNELDFHELDEHAVSDWDGVRATIRGLGAKGRVAISAVFLRLDTLLVGAGEAIAKDAAELQLSIAPPENAPETITISYTTSIDAWLSTTYGERYVPRDNRAVAAHNQPRLAAFLSALAALGDRLRVGSSQLYATAIDERGFREVTSLPARHSS